MTRSLIPQKIIDKAHVPLRMLVVLGMTLSMIPVFAPAAPARAAEVTSAAFSGGAGTVSVGGALYAKNGAALTLTVNTGAQTKCVEVTGAHSARQTSDSNQSAWTFSFTAGAGDGVKTVTATARPGVNSNGNCTGNPGSGAASYLLDNTGPTVTALLAPQPNAAGWNNSAVDIAWSASDGSGAGVASGPTPAADSVTANGATTRTATASDRLGNMGSGSVTVKVDTQAPSISGSRSPAANGFGWNKSDVTVSFACDDAGGSGIKSCTNATTTVSAEQANQTVSGAAVDNADNSASATVVVNIDKTAPSLSGAPTSAPSGASTDASGAAIAWYNGDVTIAWTCGDALSGIDGACPTAGVITGEGVGLAASASVSDKAGNAANAVSARVNIDRTGPSTDATAPAGWKNTDQTVTLAAADALSGVKATSYILDGGAQQTGASVAVAGNGVHSLEFWSEDNAGNVEAHKTIQIKIDGSSPTIIPSQSPAANANDWNNTTVTVHFECADALSGIADCTPDQVIATEGKDQIVSGAATDNAGNSATATESVSIDATAPTVTAAADHAPNANLAANGQGWRNADVTVSFTCADALSGVDSCPAPQTLGEGYDQSASGAATDAAGNSASASVSGVNIDKTAPALAGAAAPAPNGAGWRNGDVTVTWTCGDALSGIDGACPIASAITGEGDDLSASASVSDKAGNSTSATIDGVKIDRAAPSTSASVPAALESGWYAGPVEVTLTGVDSLSGVEQTYYSVDGGAAQLYSAPFSHGLKGVHTIAYWSADKAGNVEDAATAGNSLTLKIDDIAPSTGATVTPATPNGSNGWYTTALEIALTAQDAESGVAATYYRVDASDAQVYAGPFAFSQPGAHVIAYWSVDKAGNVEDAVASGNSLAVQFDNAPPTIVESGRTPAANSFGWNNSDVTVSFACVDAASQVASCPDLLFSNEGANQQQTATATDNAGNSASLLVSDINIDKTAPVLSGAPTTAANAAGWHKGDVVIDWTAADGLSGIDPATDPANSTIVGEGGNLSAGPVTVADKAGNSASATVSGIKIDRTPPSISGATVSDAGAPRSANAAGWFNSAVRVRFACADALSGVQECASDVALSSDGANQSASGAATDNADNSASVTVSGINIDSKAPKTDADLACASKNGWCRGQTATVVLAASDQAGLSGVKEIRYSVNGGPWQAVSGASASVNVPLAAKSGLATVQFRAVDNADNIEPLNGVSLKYDNIAPTVSGSRNPAANAAGWNRADVTVHFDAVDDSDGSGVDTATITPNVVVSAETAGQTVNGAAYDLAGNKGTTAVLVKLDKTAPTISGAATTSPNANGWYSGPVTVTFTCGDALSGIAVCPADVTLNSDGAGQSASGAATDVAGNSASATVSGIKIDTTKPTITVHGVADGGVYTLGAVPSASCDAADGGSGLAGACSVSVTGGAANGVGTFAFTATAIDQAGNTTTVTGAYKVIYRWDGFLQPINDTAHQVGVGVSIFKAGSTAPVKFQLKTADGAAVQANSATPPQWMTPARGSATTAPVDESAYSDPATSGSSFKWDSASQQYSYNWGTAKNQANYYWRIGVKLDDGQIYYVNIGLR